MDPITALVFACAVTWYGSKSGAVRSVRAIRDGRRDRKASRPDPRPSPSGVRLGGAVSAGVTAGGLAVRDFRTGWGAGWRDGKQRARDKRDVRRDQHDARRLTPAPTHTETETVSRRVDGKPETEADTRFFDLRETGYDGPIDQDGYPTEMPETADAYRHHPQDAPPTEDQPAPVVTLVKETPAMPEIASLPELIMWLNGIQAEAAAELEDAQARQKRAADLATQIDHVLANLQSLGLSNEDLNAVGDLLDPAGARLQAAVVDTDAADTMVTAAETAATFITARHAALQEAVDEAPAPASMTFYENGKAAA